MTVTSPNPNHPASRAMLDEQNQMAIKIILMIMMQMGINPLVITRETIDTFAAMPEGDRNIATKFDDEKGITIYSVNAETAKRLAQREGGLPI